MWKFSRPTQYGNLGIACLVAASLPLIFSNPVLGQNAISACIGDFSGNRATLTGTCSYYTLPGAAGAVSTAPAGTYYSGSLVNGIPSGQGVLVYPTNDRYEG